MAWVQMVAEEAASGKLQEMYQRVRERAGVLPNIAKVQSLRPETTERGFDLYFVTLMISPTPGGSFIYSRPLVKGQTSQPLVVSSAAGRE
jgi:hypothetical protein